MFQGKCGWLLFIPVGCRFGFSLILFGLSSDTTPLQLEDLLVGARMIGAFLLNDVNLSLH